MLRWNLPQKSSSQLARSPALSATAEVVDPRSLCSPPQSTSPVACFTCGYSELPAMPSCARASMIRRPAVRTLGLARSASATSRSSTGSLKRRHHSSVVSLLRAPFVVDKGSSEPPVQLSSQGTSGRLKSGPSVVQAPSSAAQANATARAAQRFTGIPRN